MKNTLRNLILVPLFAVTSLYAQQVISQAPDGAGWKFTLVVTNTTAAETAASITFYQDTGGGNTAAWTPPLVEAVNLSALALPAGSSVFLHSTGTAAALTQGWAQISSTPGVEAYIIYTLTSGQTSSDATAPAVASATRILVPFDNTGSLGTELAVVNPNLAQETIYVTFRTTSGAINTAPGSGYPLADTFNMPSQGHVAVVMPTQFPFTQGQAGLAEFYTLQNVGGGSFAIVALRSNSNPATGFFSFTSAPTYSETGPPIICPSCGAYDY